MAIVIEEEKRRINWFTLAVIILIVATIVATIYYLFFASVPLIEKVAPPRLQSLKEISSLKLQPEDVLNNQTFQILRQYINPIEVGPSGKTNPFLK